MDQFARMVLRYTQLAIAGCAGMFAGLVLFEYLWFLVLHRWL
jgi:hypothetical protein